MNTDPSSRTTTACPAIPKYGCSGTAALLESLGADHMPSMAFSGELSFPYEFPKPGRYRVWVQVKPREQVLTGMFDVEVR